MLVAGGGITAVVIEQKNCHKKAGDCREQKAFSFCTVHIFYYFYRFQESYFMLMIPPGGRYRYFMTCIFINLSHLIV